MPSHFVAWTVIARAPRPDFPEERFYALGGVPTAKIAALLIAEAGLTLDPVAIALEKEQVYYDSLAAGGGLQPIAPVLEIARRPPRRGRPLAIASGSVRRLVDAHARRARHRRLVRRRRRAPRTPPATSPSPTSSWRRRAASASTPRRLHRLRGHRHRPRSRPPRRHDAASTSARSLRDAARRQRHAVSCRALAALMPKNAAIFERSWFFCTAVGDGRSARRWRRPASTCRRDRMSLMTPASSGFSCEDLLERLLLDDVALDVGLRDHGRGARLAGHQRHLAEELPVAQRRDLLRSAPSDADLHRHLPAAHDVQRIARIALAQDHLARAEDRRGAAGAPAGRSSRRPARGTRRRATARRPAARTPRRACAAMRSSFISVMLTLSDGNGISMPGAVQRVPDGAAHLAVDARRRAGSRRSSSGRRSATASSLNSQQQAVGRAARRARTGSARTASTTTSRTCAGGWRKWTRT